MVFFLAALSSEEAYWGLCSLVGHAAGASESESTCWLLHEWYKSGVSSLQTLVLSLTPHLLLCVIAAEMRGGEWGSEVQVRIYLSSLYIFH